MFNIFSFFFQSVKSEKYFEISIREIVNLRYWCSGNCSFEKLTLIFHLRNSHLGNLRLKNRVSGDFERTPLTDFKKYYRYIRLWSDWLIHILILMIGRGKKIINDSLISVALIATILLKILFWFLPTNKKITQSEEIIFCCKLERYFLSNSYKISQLCWINYSMLSFKVKNWTLQMKIKWAHRGSLCSMISRWYSNQNQLLEKYILLIFP